MDNFLDDDEADTGFQLEADEVQREMLGLKSSLIGGEDESKEQTFSTAEEGDDSPSEQEVEELEAMMRKLVAAATPLTRYHKVDRVRNRLAAGG